MAGAASRAQFEAVVVSVGRDTVVDLAGVTFAASMGLRLIISLFKL